MPIDHLGVVGFDQELNIMVDQMSIMYPNSDIAWLEEKIAIHKRHTKEQLKVLGRQTVARCGPSVELNFNPDFFNS